MADDDPNAMDLDDSNSLVKEESFEDMVMVSDPLSPRSERKSKRKIVTLPI